MFHYIATIFSEDDEGKIGSSSRVYTGAVVLAVLGWVTFLVVKNKVLPDLIGPATFIASTASVFLGWHKAGSLISAWKGDPKQ